MKVLVQRSDTGEYCMDKSRWTKDCNQARDFETSVRALDFCRDCIVPDAQVVLKFENGRYDLIFPTVTESAGNAP